MTRAPQTRFQLAELGALLADPGRAGILLSLMDGTLRPADELARMAGIAPSTASGHLRRLEEGGLIRVNVQGRHRYYAIADDHVAHMLETLTVGRERPRLRRSPTGDPVMDRARTCYDHLAGRLGVRLFDAMRAGDGWTLADDAVRLSEAGTRTLTDAGLIDAADERAALPGRTCVDWTERRFHLGGPLGAWLTGRLFDAGWLRRRASTRALFITDAGNIGLRDLGVERS